jgi:hypothetical protein
LLFPRVGTKPLRVYCLVFCDVLLYAAVFEECSGLLTVGVVVDSCLILCVELW